MKNGDNGGLKSAMDKLSPNLIPSMPSLPE